ncbi:hypothetical protein LC605_12335 [Nostoc sp. CHAB 5836]|nr:hypothetical protein [Nostoc sp. CHAB 5836]
MTKDKYFDFAVPERSRRAVQMTNDSLSQLALFASLYLPLICNKFFP